MSRLALPSHRTALAGLISATFAVACTAVSLLDIPRIRADAQLAIPDCTCCRVHPTDALTPGAIEDDDESGADQPRAAPEVPTTIWVAPERQARIDGPRPAPSLPTRSYRIAPKQSPPALAGHH